MVATELTATELTVDSNLFSTFYQQIKYTFWKLLIYIRVLLVRTVITRSGFFSILHFFSKDTRPGASNAVKFMRFAIREKTCLNWPFIKRHSKFIGKDTLGYNSWKLSHLRNLANRTKIILQMYLHFCELSINTERHLLWNGKFVNNTVFWVATDLFGQNYQKNLRIINFGISFNPGSTWLDENLHKPKNQSIDAG